jgi:hypothetical protein
MGKDVSDDALINICDTDLAWLLTQPVQSRIRTALDRFSAHSDDTYNGFNNSI